MNKKAIFCKFFGAGNCRFGAQCEFSHDPVVKSSNATMAAGAAPAVADTTPAAPTAAPILIALKPGVPVFAIDVECVATGTQHNARAVAQIAVVNQAKEVILSVCKSAAFVALVRREIYVSTRFEGFFVFGVMRCVSFAFRSSRFG